MLASNVLPVYGKLERRKRKQTSWETKPKNDRESEHLMVKKVARLACYTEIRFPINSKSSRIATMWCDVPMSSKRKANGSMRI